MRGGTPGPRFVEGEVTWPLLSPEQKGWGEGKTEAPGSLYPAPGWAATVLGPAALVTRPGQAKAEKPGSMEERGHDPGMVGPELETLARAGVHHRVGPGKDG